MDDAWNLDLPCEVSEKRLKCDHCKRPSTVCLCPFLPNQPVDIKSTVYILQHPREVHRAVRTDYLIQGCLPEDKCVIFKGTKFHSNRSSTYWYPQLEAVCSSPDTIILYPGPDAIDITAVPPVQNGRHGYNIILVDGTWSQARSMFKSNPVLRQVQQVQITNVGLSEFVIRTQPTDGHLSTVESAAIALSVLEKNPEIREIMMKPLRALCQFQLDHGAVVHQSKDHQESKNRKEEKGS